MLLLNKQEKIKQKAILRAVEYRHFTKLRLINLIILGISVFAIFSLGIFMYQRIYTTIGQIQTIGLLKNQLGEEAIDFKTLGEVEAAWQTKHSATTTVVVRDPFNPVIIAGQTTTSTIP